MIAHGAAAAARVCVVVMRLAVLLACCVVAAAADIACAVRPAGAQTIIQQIFGRPAQAPRYVLRRQPSPWFFGDDRPRGQGAYGDQNYWSYGDSDRGYPLGEPTYQTLCVRMCDGYYWPISAAATRAQMYGDARRCTASCDAEARLFYRPIVSGDAALMTDLTGRSYAQLPNAFRYRKALVEGCMCRPAPWSASEIDRHEQYAAEAQIMAGRAPPDRRQSDVDAEPVAGVYGAPERTPAVIDDGDVAEDDAISGDTQDAAPTFGAYENPPTRWSARARVRYTTFPATRR